MDQILDIGDVFGLGASDFNPLLLIPVVFVVVGLVATFAYGFKREESPKICKFETNMRASVSGVNPKRKKRNVESNSSANTSSKTLKEQQRTTKKDVFSNAISDKSTPVNAKHTAIVRKDVKSPETALKGLVKSSKFLNMKLVEGEGEWQTVTKKHKKPTEQAITEITEVLPKTEYAEKNIKSSERANSKKNRKVAATIDHSEKVEEYQKPASVYTHTVSDFTSQTYTPLDELDVPKLTEPKTIKKIKRRALKE